MKRIEPMWTCPECGEGIQDQFRECWKCAGGRLEPAPEVRVPDLKVYGLRIPWALAFVILLVVLLFLESTHSARGNLSRLATTEKAWMCLLAATAVGVVTRLPFALRTSAVLLALGALLKLVVLFLVTASSDRPGTSSIEWEAVQVLGTAGAAVILIIHLRNPGRSS